ncbi:MAG: 50S ribosomal protein L3 [Candidatus Omnitrophica bacterium]|nr:50S ribosomal protein L3 [Candidatus Omnitrophota bacterium]MCF7887880.1 50S ribosomal protein L3 [Candidatus Omnitrophota bacterium]
MIKEIFGKKIGMTQMFSPEGELLPVTLVEVEPACVLEKITYANKERAKIGCFKIKDTKISKVKKPQRGYFEKIGVPPYKLIKEVEIEKYADFSFPKEEKEKEAKKEKAITTETQKDTEIQKKPEEDKGEKQQEESKEDVQEESKEEKKVLSRYVGIEIFSQGQLLTARAKTKGKGFAGAIKRHKMHRQPSSHGSGMHRRVGSVGASATPSKIAKNKKMPGHFGSSYRVTKNLKILKVDVEKKVIFIRGNIAGSNGTIVRLTKQN